MTARVLGSLVIAASLLVPVGIWAQGQTAQPLATPVVTITTSPDSAGGSFRSVWPTGAGEFYAEAKTFKVSYTATGLTVEMTDGTLRTSKKVAEGTVTTSAPDPFKALQFSFSGGEMNVWWMKK